MKEGYPFRRVYDWVASAINQTDGDINKFILFLTKKTKTSTDTIRKMLTPEFSIKNKISSGGTGFNAVNKQIIIMKRLLSKNKAMVEHFFKFDI
ncbi:MAG: hypothetical protein ACUVTF_03845 [bacterium]